MTSYSSQITLDFYLQHLIKDKWVKNFWQYVGNLQVSIIGSFEQKILQWTSIFSLINNKWVKVLMYELLASYFTYWSYECCCPHFSAQFFFSPNKFQKNIPTALQGHYVQMQGYNTYTYTLFSRQKNDSYITGISLILCYVVFITVSLF